MIVCLASPSAPAAIRLEFDIEISMCRVWNTQVTRTNMLWEQVSGYKSISKSANFFCLITSNNYEGQEEMRKYKSTTCLGMLLPSSAFLAEEAVSASVYWIKACQDIKQN